MYLVAFQYNYTGGNKGLLVVPENEILSLSFSSDRAYLKTRQGEEYILSKDIQYLSLYEALKQISQ